MLSTDCTDCTDPYGLFYRGDKATGDRLWTGWAVACRLVTGNRKGRETSAISAISAVGNRG
jgi:hypothetical protein